MIMTGMYSSQESRRTLAQEFMTGYLRQAQWAEAVELKKIITELYERKGSPIDVLDIGVGDGRVPVNIAEIDEISNCIRSYRGIDNDYEIVKIAFENIEKLKFSNKVQLKWIDARYLSREFNLDVKYDLVLCTYFTAGNFPPDSYSFTKNANVDDLENKKAFQDVFKSKYNLLRPSGKLVLGSIYIDNPSTARRQREFYEKCGMTVITPEETPFTATKEGFWSLRFTEERIRDFFDFVKPENIELRPLDTYNFAQMVIISKK